LDFASFTLYADALSIVSRGAAMLPHEEVIRSSCDRGHRIMNRTPDDAERLLTLLVAICGEQISDYRPRIEVLVATLIANRHFVKPDSADGRPVARVHRDLAP
jgi:hypothetical protein